MRHCAHDATTWLEDAGRRSAALYSSEVSMHTRETLGSGWWHNAGMAGKLALWLGIALLIGAALPSHGGAVGLAVAAAPPAHHAPPNAGAAARFHGQAHPPARTIAPQDADSTLAGRIVNADGTEF